MYFLKSRGRNILLNKQLNISAGRKSLIIIQETTDEIMSSSLWLKRRNTKVIYEYIWWGWSETYFFTVDVELNMNSSLHMFDVEVGSLLEHKDSERSITRSQI